MTKNTLAYHEHLQNQMVGDFITNDDITNLKICLGISKSVDEFLKNISSNEYIKEGV